MKKITINELCEIFASNLKKEKKLEYVSAEFNAWHEDITTFESNGKEKVLDNGNVLTECHDDTGYTFYTLDIINEQGDIVDINYYISESEGI